MMGGNMMGGFGGPGGLYGIVGGLFMLAFWVLVIALIALGIKWLVTQGGGVAGSQVSSESALELLRRRYAAGDIDTKEYEERKRVLTG